MASPFLAAFNAALPDLEASFTEDWVFKGVTYPAIAIDHESDTSKQMKGGEYEDVTTIIHVRLAVFLQSKVSSGDIVTSRGQDFAVVTIEQDGDDARAIVCGSPQIDVWAK